MPWNEADRVKYEVIRDCYSSDMSDTEFELISLLLPAPKRRGRKPTDFRIFGSAARAFTGRSLRSRRHNYRRPVCAGWARQYAGVDGSAWLAGPKRVRQQSIRYGSYLQEFDVDLAGVLRIVDFGDAGISEESNYVATVDNILRARHAVEEKVAEAMDVGAVPIEIGQNSPCGSYAIAKPIAQRANGKVGVISLDTHWDAGPIDRATMDPRIAGTTSGKHKFNEWHKNISVPHLVEIDERGMLEDKTIVRRSLREGAHFVPMWRLRTGLGTEGLCAILDRAYDGTSDVYVHFDMDVLGGAGPAGGDILGELAEPIGMSDYEVIRIAHEIGLRGLTSMSFICIPPGSPVIY